MSKRGLIATAFVLAGVYVWVAYGISTLVYVSNFLPAMRDVDGGGLVMAVGAGVFIAIVFAAGYAFIFYAPKLARKLVLDSTADGPAFPWRVDNIQAAALSILGVCLCVKGLWDFGNAVVQVVFLGWQPAAEHMGGAYSHLAQQIARGAIDIALGLVLFFKARAITAFWRRMQESREGINRLQTKANSGSMPTIRHIP